MTEHDGHGAAYTRGYRKAQVDNRGNLLRTLKGLINTGELSTDVAREIFAGVYDGVEASQEFGEDPRLDGLLG